MEKVTARREGIAVAIKEGRREVLLMTSAEAEDLAVQLMAAANDAKDMEERARTALAGELDKPAVAVVTLTPPVSPSAVVKAPLHVGPPGPGPIRES